MWAVAGSGFFSDREWLRMKKDTTDGKCIQCMPLPRSANGSRRRRICGNEKLLEEFAMWHIAHGYTHDRHRRVTYVCSQKKQRDRT